MGRVIAVLFVALLALPVDAVAGAPRSDGSTAAPPAITQLVASVPVSTLNQVGAGELSGPREFGVFKLHRHLTRHGKPELLTMNFAWCPHCAANSWALAVALSRFGTLTGLRVLDSGTFYCTVISGPCTLGGSGPCFPHTHGLSFLGAHYQSRYLSFAHIVLQDVRGHNLERPTREDISALKPFDPQAQTPAVDVGGGYGFVNSGFQPGVLAHKTWSQIAGSLAAAHNRIALHVDGLANLFAAAICKGTKGRPAGVCRSHGVLAAGAAHLH